MAPRFEFLCAIFAAILFSVQSAPVQEYSETQAAMYLSRFGYLDPKIQNAAFGAILSEDSLRAAILDFQAFAGLNQTGELNEETIELMGKPRCGVKDRVGSGTRAKRFALQGSRWRVKELTYRITKYPAGKLGRDEVDKEIARAFQVWAEVTELSFTRRTSGKVHIEIRFETGEHGDGDPFDGVGGTLAHAYFPIYGGDAHFDDTEPWTINSYRGTNLFQVAAHEFGHSLGLSHSDVKSALMAPFYRGYTSPFKLDNDDIVAIQSLYGKKKSLVSSTTVKPKTPSRPNNPEDNNELCATGKFDTIFTTQDSNTYVFKGDKYWKLDGDTVASGYPRSISSDWGGLPGNIDAAFTWTNGRTYFFKGSKYWRFTDSQMDLGYPKDLSEGFQGVPSNVDTAFVWGGNGKIYFFKGSQYWRFDPSQRPPVSPKYPKDISNWEGLPNSIDAAFQYSNGHTYFFKNGQYWRFNDRSFKVDEGEPVYPRPAGPWWFGCKSSGSNIVETKGNNIQADMPYEDLSDADLLDAGLDHVSEVDNSLHPQQLEVAHNYVQSSSAAVQTSFALTIVMFLAHVKLNFIYTL